MSIALWITATCLGFLALVYLWQDRLLYFPQRATVEEVASAGLRPWPSAQAFRGLVAEPRGTVRGTAIVFHGNAGHVGHRAFYAQALVPLGVRVILAEYPGYGPRAGKPWEANFIRDASEVVALAHGQYGGSLLLVGESLGAAVAAGAGALQPERTAGLVLITPWERLANVASHHYPWLPVKWLLRDRYDTAARLARFDRPVVVVVAEQDRIVPARFGVALHTTLGGPKHLMQIDGAGHNDWPGRVDAAWWRRATRTVD
ncbi:MAG: alpha/beta hydrolase [Rubrivivax sp.]|nr:alpha/beta hydrolase [Rubrivivax sp.]